MSKKVQYVIGAVGLLPALGLAAQPAAGASAQASTKPAHTSGKRVNATSCYGHTEHQAFSHGVFLTFWSAPVGSRRCIGTIEVSAKSTSAVGALVNNAYGNFCSRAAGGGHFTDVCRRVFRTNGLRVLGWKESFYGGGRSYVSFRL
jgi:hypothetical protein